MSPAEVVNTKSEAELEKALRLELIWFAGEECAKLPAAARIREHCLRVSSLLHDLEVEKFINSQKRVPDSKQSRSWHR